MSAKPEASLPQMRRNADQRSFRFARIYAWVIFLSVTALFSVFSFYIGNKVLANFVTKQEEFSVLLADNINSQLYRRFTLPVMLAFGEVSLSNESQYERLDQLIHLVTTGMNVSNLRVLSNEQIISYSLDKEELGTKVLDDENIRKVSTSIEPSFSLHAKLPYWQAFFTYPLEANSYTLRIAYPLATDNRSYSSKDFGPVLGVLEFSRDITPDIQNAIRFQRFILGIASFSVGAIFILLLYIIRRAEKAVARRILEEQRLEFELHQSEKLAGMGRVIASIAHEIRNPLGIICSSVELLLKRESDKHNSAHRILEAMHDESKRLSQTVSDFLDYAKPLSLKLVPVDIVSVIDKSLVFLEPDLQNREILIARVPHENKKFYAMGDGDLLYRAFFNIIANALQSMHSSGTLSISIEESATPSKDISIIFHDSGPGFPPESIDRLLDPFFTTKDNGTGLGLAIVHNIILGHNGHLRLYNNPSGGAVVEVLLPQTDLETISKKNGSL